MLSCSLGNTKCVYTFSAKDTKTHNSSRGSSPLGSVTGVTENFLEDGQSRELDELLKSFDVDEKVLRNHVFCC